MTTKPFIANEADAFHNSQAEPEAEDFQTLLAGHGHTGVVWGCEVTESSPPAQTVDLAAGQIRIDGRVVDVAAAADIAIDAAHGSLARRDVLSIGVDGTLAVTAGTASAEPLITPATPASRALVAVRTTPGGNNVCENEQLNDKRTPVPPGAVEIAASVSLNWFQGIATINTTGAPRTITIPLSADYAGQAYLIRCKGPNTATINMSGADTYDDASTGKILTNGQDLAIYTTGDGIWVEVGPSVAAAGVGIPVFNIETYGAVASDTTTYETANVAAIPAAINAAEAAGGGWVFTPARLVPFRINSHVATTIQNVGFVGVNAGASMWKCVTPAVGFVLRVVGAGGEGATKQGEIRDMSIMAAATGTSGIRLTDTVHYRLENLFVTGHTTSAKVRTGATGILNEYGSAGSARTFINNVNVRSFVGSGIEFDGDPLDWANRNTILQAVAWNCGVGLRFQNGSDTNWVRFESEGCSIGVHMGDSQETEISMFSEQDDVGLHLGSSNTCTYTLAISTSPTWQIQVGTSNHNIFIGRFEEDEVDDWDALNTGENLLLRRPNGFQEANVIASQFNRPKSRMAEESYATGTWPTSGGLRAVGYLNFKNTLFTGTLEIRLGGGYNTNQATGEILAVMSFHHGLGAASLLNMSFATPIVEGELATRYAIGPPVVVATEIHVPVYRLDGTTTSAVTAYVVARTAVTGAVAFKMARDMLDAAEWITPVTAANSEVANIATAAGGNQIVHVPAAGAAVGKIAKIVSTNPIVLSWQDDSEGSGSTPTPNDTRELLVPNSGATAYITSRSRGEWIGTHHTGGGAPWDGTTDGMPAMRAAQAALGGPGRVHGPDGVYVVGSTETVGGLAVGCHFLDRQYLELAGHGSARGQIGGNPENCAPSVIAVTNATPAIDAALMWRSTDGNPRWPGGGGVGFHVGDFSTGNDQCEMGVLVQGINGLLFKEVSLGPFLKETGTPGAFRVIRAANNQPTQYGEMYSFDMAECFYGLVGDNNNPDWVFHHGSIQKSAGLFWPGSRGLFYTGSKWDIHDVPIQFYDYNIYVDGTIPAENRGAHMSFTRIHLEGDAGAVIASGTATASHAGGTQLTDSGGGFTGIEVGQPVFNVTDGSKGYVTSVDSDTQITHTALSGGTENDWDSGESYDVAGYSSALYFKGNSQEEMPVFDLLDMGQAGKHNKIIELINVGGYQMDKVRRRDSAWAAYNDSDVDLTGSDGFWDGTARP